MNVEVWLGALFVPALVGSFAIGVVMIIGARKMMRLESYRWAMAASVLALLPCSPVGLLGLVMGIWSLVVLNRQNVRAAFDVSNALPPTRRSSGLARAAGDADLTIIEEARSRVIAPAIALIVGAVLSLPMVPIVTLSSMRLAFLSGRPAAEQWLASAVPIGTGLVMLAVPVVIIVGAVKMLRVTSHGWARMAAILSILWVPAGPFWLITLPIGIWALVAVSRPAVKAGFQARKAPPAAGGLPGASQAAALAVGPTVGQTQRKASPWPIIVAVVLGVGLLSACLLGPLLGLALTFYRHLEVRDARLPGPEISRMAPELMSKTGDMKKSDLTSAPPSPTGWTLGPDGPVLTDMFSRTVLNLQPAQIEEVNRILQEAYREYPALELQNSEQSTNAAGHNVVRIKPFPESIAKLEDRLWSQLDAILDPQQQSVARLNLKLDPPEAIPPISLSDLVRPGFFGWGKAGATIEIWRVGTWYHWKVQTRGYQDSSRAPQLPEGYRRFWKDGATATPEKAIEPGEPTPREDALDDGATGYYERETFRRPAPIAPGGGTPPTHVAFSPDGDTLTALIGFDIHSWDVRTNTALGRRPIGRFIEAAFSGTLAPNGETITLVRLDGSAELWDIAQQKRLAQMDAGAALHAVFSPDRKTLAVSSIQQRGLPRLGPDGKTMVVGVKVAALELWDVAAGSRRASVATEAPLMSLAFTGDGSLVAGGCADGTVRLVEVESGEALTTLRGLSETCTCLAFSPDGSKLTAGTPEGTIAVWHVGTGNREATIQGQPGLSSLAFRPDGSYLAAGSVDGTVKIWQTPDALRPPRETPTRVRLVRVGLLPPAPNDRFLDVAIQGKYAYVGTTRGLTITEISEPANLRVVGSCALDGPVEALAVAGPIACALVKDELRVVDVSDPESPRAVGACRLGEHLRRIALSRPAAAGEARDDGRETDKPAEAGTTNAYVVDGDSLRVVDLSNPALPTEVGRFDAPEADLNGYGTLAVAGRYACVGADTAGLRIVDVSDPKATKEIGAFEGPGNAIHVTLVGNFAYIAGGEDAVSLWIVDISDPKGPREAGRYGDWVTGGGVAVQEGMAFLLGGELDILDVSDPAAPKPAGLYTAPGDPGGVVGWHVAATGNYVYIVSEAGLSILRVVGKVADE